MNFKNTLEFAQQLDAQDSLRSYQNEFIFPQVNNQKVIYFTGNSLGLQPKRTKTYDFLYLEMLRDVEPETLIDLQGTGESGFFHGKSLRDCDLFRFLDFGNLEINLRSNFDCF